MGDKNMYVQNTDLRKNKGKVTDFSTFGGGGKALKRFGCFFLD